MPPRALQIETLARTIDCHFALFAAALRTNPSVNGWAEALLLPGFADLAAQNVISDLIMARG
jgi:hypothetical protein